MCKANGRRWSDFREAVATNTYAEALSRKTGIPVYDLMVSKQGDGTWVHPDIATELARWISADFSVFVNQWFREELESRASQARETQPALNPQQQDIAQALANVETGLRILEHLGVCDDRDRLQYKRYANMLVQASTIAAGALPGVGTGLLSPVEELPKLGDKVVDPEVPLTIVEFASCYLAADEAKAIGRSDSAIGRSVHAVYKQRHGEPAGTTTHLSVKAEEGRQRLRLPVFGSANNGNAVSPRVYLPRDWDLIIDELRQRGVLAPDRAATLRAQLQQFRHGQPD